MPLKVLSKYGKAWYRDIEIIFIMHFNDTY